MKKIVCIAFVTLFTLTSIAQTKVGTVDTDFALSKMPELIKFQEDLEVYNKGLQNQLKNKIDNYENVFKVAEAQYPTMSLDEKKTKEEELKGLENDIEKFRNNGSQLVKLKEGELLTPLYKKIGDTVALVAKELGYTQILNIGNNSNLAYIDPAHDITIKVLAKMGVVIEE
jgi:outer membrane protein